MSYKKIDIVEGSVVNMRDVEISGECTIFKGIEVLGGFPSIAICAGLMRCSASLLQNSVADLMLLLQYL